LVAVQVAHPLALVALVALAVVVVLMVAMLLALALLVKAMRVVPDILLLVAGQVAEVVQVLLDRLVKA
jgi:hypothetical protein